MCCSVLFAVVCCSLKHVLKQMYIYIYTLLRWTRDFCIRIEWKIIYEAVVHLNVSNLMSYLNIMN